MYFAIGEGLHKKYNTLNRFYYNLYILGENRNI